MEKSMKELKRNLAFLLGTMMRRAALTLLLAVCTMTAGAAGLHYFHLNADNGTTNISGQPYGVAVDGNKGSVWCVNNLSSLEGTLYIEVHTDQPVCPLSYVFTTGADNDRYNGRNPKSWKVFAKQNANEPYPSTPIAEVTDDDVMQDVNTMDYEFFMNNSSFAKYQYFRFVFTATQGANEFQLGEIQIRGIENPTFVNLSSLQGGVYEVSDGAVLTGTSPNNLCVKVTSQGDATVILNNASIVNQFSSTAASLMNNGSCISCGTDVTLFLAKGSSNTLTCSGYHSPAIDANLGGGAVTIEGPGRLEANGGGESPGIGGYGNIDIRNNVGSVLACSEEGSNSIASYGGTLTIAGTQTQTGYIAENPYRYTSTNMLLGNGGEGYPYFIYCHSDWKIFASMITHQAYCDKYYKLMSDINVGDVIAWTAYTFKGTFDGDGHTITIDYGDNRLFSSPFAAVTDATIKNLRVSGTITTERQHAASIASNCSGATNIINCVSDVVFNSSINGDGSHGGFVGEVITGTTRISGCSFTGKFNLTNFSDMFNKKETTNCGGFVGWVRDNGHVIIKDCLFDPEEVDLTEGNLNFARASKTTGVDLENCYYRNSFELSQGKRAYAFTLADGIHFDSWNNSTYEEKNYYDVSDITIIAVDAHSNILDPNSNILDPNYTPQYLEFVYNLMKYGQRYFVEEGQYITVAYTGPVPEGYTFNNIFKCNEEEALWGIRLPAADATITPQFNPISYSLTYDLTGGTVATDNPTSYTIEDDDITLVNPTRDGFYFAGWTGTGLNEPTQTVTIPKGSMGNRSYRAALVRTELADGLDYDIYIDVNVPTASYTKTLGSERVGKHQAWFLPFEYTITSSDTEKFSFYKLNMIANSPAPGQDGNPDEMWVFVTPVAAGTVLHANMPYVYKPKEAVTDYQFTTLNATMKVPEAGAVATMQTMEDIYDVYGTYTNTSPSASDPFYYANIDGEFSFGNESTVVVGPYRWIIRKTSKYGGATSNARRMFIYDGESATGEQTGISTTSTLFPNGAEWYDLQGRKLSGKPAKGGVYVVNGKKVVVK